MQNSPRPRRLLLAVLAVVVGLFMIIMAPYLIQISMERIVAALVEVSKTKPQYTSGVMLFSFAFPLYRALFFIGGVALVLFARPIYKGEEWTYPASLLASAFPSAGGMFMFLPYISWVEGFPIPMIISWVGLAFFWTMILIRNVNKWQKWAHFLALTFMGMLTTHAFVVGVGNFRMLLTRPEKPLYTGLEWWVLSWSAPIQWICVVLLFTGLYLLAARKTPGWWLGLISAGSLLAIDAPTQVIRSLLSDSTSLDYLYGSLLSAGLLFSLLFPKFRQALLPETQEDRTVSTRQGTASLPGPA